MVRVVELKDVITNELFRTSGYMLGDNSGNYFVVSDGVYLGRYEDRHKAQEHADTLNNISKEERIADSKLSTEEKIKLARKAVADAEAFLRDIKS